MATPNVLFVCLHGSAKSVIAAEHFRRLARERGVMVEAVSAGIEPDSELPPKVVQGLLASGIDVSGLRPHRVTRADVERASRVITFGCELGDLAPAGLVVERWDDVPLVSEDFNRARDVIVARVSRILDECAKASSSPRLVRPSVRARAFGACLLLIALWIPRSGWAYRPFIATDAAVADPREVEIELGYFTLDRAKGETAFTIPRVVLNYGFLENSEAVGEFSILRSPDTEPERSGTTAEGPRKSRGPAREERHHHRDGARAPAPVDGQGSAPIPLRSHGPCVSQARSMHVSRERGARRVTVDRRSDRDL